MWLFYKPHNYPVSAQSKNPPPFESHDPFYQFKDCKKSRKQVGHASKIVTLAVLDSYSYISNMY